MSRALFTRRTFVRSTVVTSAAVVAVTTTAAAGDPGPAGELEHRQVVLDLARLIATTPAPFPTFWESGPAWQRAVEPRLTTAVNKVSRRRAQLAERGAARLATACFGGATDARVRLIGRLVAGNDAVVRAELRAVVALAVATVSTHYRPEHDAAADLWLGFSRHYYLRTRAR